MFYTYALLSQKDSIFHTVYANDLKVRFEKYKPYLTGRILNLKLFFSKGNEC